MQDEGHGMCGVAALSLPPPLALRNPEDRKEEGRGQREQAGRGPSLSSYSSNILCLPVEALEPRVCPDVPRAPLEVPEPARQVRRQQLRDQVPAPPKPQQTSGATPLAVPQHNTYTLCSTPSLTPSLGWGRARASDTTNTRRRPL
eukprot:3465755-Rhodomonas_salina.1